MTDPTTPLSELTPEQVSEYVDTHLISALVGADSLHYGNRQDAEDYVRDRLVALSDTYDPAGAVAERSRRMMARLRAAILENRSDPCEQGHLMQYHKVTNEPVCCQRCGKTIDQIEEEEQQ